MEYTIDLVANILTSEDVELGEDYELANSLRWT